MFTTYKFKINNMKSIQFTPTGQSLFDQTNQIFEDDEDADYYELTPEQQFILDCGMYINGAYSDNSFETIEDFALAIGGEEYQDAAEGADKVIKKINKGIELDLITIK